MVLGVVPGRAVMSEQGVGGARVEDHLGRCVVAYPYHLGAARQEVQDPFAEGGVQSQGC